MRLERLQEYLGVSARDARTLMRAIDTDGDGWVSFQEVDDYAELHTEYVDEQPSEATVYIARDSDGQVLYVGITGCNIRRLHSHAKASKWWPLAASVQLEHQRTRRLAEARERQLIRQLHPAFNITYAELA